MGADVAACLFDVQLRERSVVGAGTSDQDVVDGRAQFVEEAPESFEVGRIEGCDARAELQAGAAEAIGVTRSKDNAGSLGPGAPRRLEPDAGAATDHDDGLSGELGLAAHADASTTHRFW